MARSPLSLGISDRGELCEFVHSLLLSFLVAYALTYRMVRQSQGIAVRRVRTATKVSAAAGTNVSHAKHAPKNPRSDSTAVICMGGSGARYASIQDQKEVRATAMASPAPG